MKEHPNQKYDIDISIWSKSKLEDNIIRFTKLHKRNKRRLVEETPITNKQRLWWEKLTKHSALVLRQLKEVAYKTTLADAIKDHS